jgi:TDG/mug DNA glycosylase family protein
MGSSVETLADLFPARPKAICVGINPAPISVQVGHYYQGTLGKRFFGRLRQAGVLDGSTVEFEDDALVEAGVGFTDIVKRPTPSADLVSAEERRYGTELLARNLTEVRTPALIFPFKDAAVALVGSFAGNGWLKQRFGGARLFVMPGPYESSATARPTVASLLSGLAAV